MSEPVKVVIEVRGGVVTSVLSGVPLDVVVVDRDDERHGEDQVFGRTFDDGNSVYEFTKAPSTRGRY